MTNRRRRENAPRSVLGIALVSPEASALAGDPRRCDRYGRELMVRTFLEVLGRVGGLRVTCRLSWLYPDRGTPDRSNAPLDQTRCSIKRVALDSRAGGYAGESRLIAGPHPVGR